MSEKFNRNDDDVTDDQFYSKDWQDDLNGVETDIFDSRRDIYINGVIFVGLIVEISNPLSPDSKIKISAGVAYDEDGKRISLPTVEDDIAVDVAQDAINYVCIRHLYIEDTPRKATKTGAEWNSRKSDSYEVVVRTEVEGYEIAGDVCLATTTGTGASIAITTDERKQPDYSSGYEGDPGVPSIVTGLTATTQPMNAIINDETTMAFNHRPFKAAILLEWNPVESTTAIERYEVMLTPWVTLGGEVWQAMIEQHITCDIQTGVVQSECAFLNLTPGMECRLRVRAVDKLDRKGPWSEPLAMIAGQTGRSRLDLTGFTIDIVSKPFGVSVEINNPPVNPSTGGYIFYYIRGTMSYPALAIDNIYIQGRRCKTFISALSEGEQVYVRAQVYDKVGWVCLGYAEGNGAAGGVG